MFKLKIKPLRDLVVWWFLLSIIVLAYTWFAYGVRLNTIDDIVLPWAILALAVYTAFSGRKGRLRVAIVYACMTWVIYSHTISPHGVLSWRTADTQLYALVLLAIITLLFWWVRPKWTAVVGFSIGLISACIISALAAKEPTLIFKVIYALTFGLEDAFLKYWYLPIGLMLLFMFVQDTSKYKQRRVSNYSSTSADYDDDSSIPAGYNLVSPTTRSKYDNGSISEEEVNYIATYGHDYGGNSDD